MSATISAIDGNYSRSLIVVSSLDVNRQQTMIVTGNPVTGAILTETVGAGPSGSVTISGLGTDNSANSTAKLPVLVGVASTAAPTWTDGNMTPVSIDTATGGVRVTLTGTSGGAIVTNEEPLVAQPSVQILASATVITLLPANPLRKKVMLYSQSTNIAYVRYGGNASLTAYAHRLFEDQPAEEFTQSEVTCIWDGTNGFIQVTEYL